MKHLLRFVSIVVLMFFLLGTTTPASADAEGYLGEIRLFAGPYEPDGWMFCDGRTLKVQDHQALFSILGTTYGGDGVQTFKIPDFRGKVPRHSARPEAMKEASYESVSSGVGGKVIPLEKPGVPDIQGGTSLAVNVNSPKRTLSVAPPYLALNFIICLSGTYPTRQ